VNHGLAREGIAKRNCKEITAKAPNPANPNSVSEKIRQPYQGLADSSRATEELTSHAAMVGLRFQFGATSAIENDRRGATFDMPDVGRWTGWTIETVD